MSGTGMLTEALLWHQAGATPVPVAVDGSKRPAVNTWKDLQTRRPDMGEVVRLFAVDHDGLGIICGAVSGNLEMFELEGRAIAEGVLADLERAFADHDARELWDRIANGYVEQTPSGGLHYHYRVSDGPAAKNTKLARRPATEAELDVDPKDRIKVLIETRGEGGFTVIAPSGGRTHPTGRAWVVVTGSRDTIPTVTAEERDALHAIASTLDRMPAPEPAAAPRSATSSSSSGLRPGDDFNNRTDWAEILEPHGWTLAHRYGGRLRAWTRPGKKPRDGISATTGRNDGDNLYVFSTSTEFESEHPYSKFAAYALLEHGGDFHAAAVALRRQGYGDDQSGPGSTASPSTGATSSTEATSGPVTLADCERVFVRWLGADYDLDALRVSLAAAAVERLDGDPLWLLLVSGSGNAKTETVGALGRVATITSTISSPGALLSATSKRERTTDATGGLLRKLGDRGVLVIKDVTSVLSMDRTARGEVLAALREVYDGHWARNVGTDGGRTLEWTGRLVVIGAVTTAWDRAHEVIAAMGDRFVLLRMDSTIGRQSAGRRAIGNTGHEDVMRAELSTAVAGVLAGMRTPRDLDEAEVDGLLQAADLVTKARTGVDRDYKGDVIDAHAPEMPTRFAKQLAQVVRGAMAIGMTDVDAMRLAIRCARDSMPPLRLAIVDDVAAHPESTATDTRRRLAKPRASVDREMQALHMLEVLVVDEQSGTWGGREVTKWLYSLAEGVEPGAIDPESVTRFVVNPTQGHKEGERETVRLPSNISGNGDPGPLPDLDDDEALDLDAAELPDDPRCSICGAALWTPDSIERGTCTGCADQVANDHTPSAEYRPMPS